MFRLRRVSSGEGEEQEQERRPSTGDDGGEESELVVTDEEEEAAEGTEESGGGAAEPEVEGHGQDKAPKERVVYRGKDLGRTPAMSAASLVEGGV